MIKAIQFKFINDKSKGEGDYFLEILDKKGKKVISTICVIDIQDITPLKGSKFTLNYFRQSAGLFGQTESVKSEEFKSRNVIHIVEAYQ